MRIGIDIGGMSVKLGAVDENYQILARTTIHKRASDCTPQELIGDIIEAVQNLIVENGWIMEQCEGVGIACPGTVDSESGVVLYSNNMKWEKIPLLLELKKHLSMHLALANDADAAVYGEFLAGAARGKESVILLTLGTGVGGGVVLNGKIFSGVLGGGCELGHMVIKAGGKKCTCGRRGCLECYGSATALMELGRKQAALYPQSQLNLLTEGDVTRIDGRLIFESEKQGDEAAQLVVEEYLEDLSTGIANLINIFRPELFLLGGGVSAQKEYLTDRLQKLVETQCFGGAYGEIPQIRTCELLNDAGIIGAAYL